MGLVVIPNRVGLWPLLSLFLKKTTTTIQPPPLAFPAQPGKGAMLGCAAVLRSVGYNNTSTR